MAKRIFIFLLSVNVIISLAQTTITDSIISGGIYRSYRLYIPSLYDGSSARPLVLNLHGYKMNSFLQQTYTNFSPIADTANFLIVYPQGTPDPQGQRFWNAKISPLVADDLGFIDHLIDSLKAQYNIDLNRLYSTGMSNGGFMSHTLACELSHRITAIASVAGSILTTQYGANCHPTRPIPVMQIHGTADPKVPYAGGLWDSLIIMPVDSVVKYWVTKNGCNPVPTFSNVPNTGLFDFSTAEHYMYKNGNLGSTVELYKIIGGGHTWPGAPIPIPTLGPTNQDLKASVTIWNFFRQYNLSQLTSINDVDNVNDKISIYPNPTTTILNFNVNEIDQTGLSVEILDVLGKVVLTEIQHSHSVKIDKLNSGIYFLSLKQGSKIFKPVKFIKE